ncbi:MAG: L,D-transpeptidase family protein [Acidobacteriota bacterium]|nr:L,D-transpeptidase family protein [Acidobacteriota bacterium]
MKISLIFIWIILGFFNGCSQDKTNLDTMTPALKLKPEMREETSSQTSEPLPKIENPRIIIRKEKRLLELFDGEKLVKTYKIALGFAPEGDKQREGDGKTPEGEFYIFTKNNQSKFYLSLGVSYPNAEAAKRGLQEAIITRKEYDVIVKAAKEKRMPPQNTRLGGEIYIHGGGTGKDWTWGCAALENKDIKEIFDAVSIGTTVSILP